jgi:phage terminase small subunit
VIARLTLKQRRFCLAFVGEAAGNGTEAARVAGYKGNDVTLAAVAYENLRKPQIMDLIASLRQEAEKRAGDKILSATETLVGITKIAESDIAELFPDDPFLQEAKRLGVSRLIKTITRDKDTGRITKLEMYSAQTSLQDMGKYHKLFPTKIEISATEIDHVIEDAINQHNLPKPETFGGELIEKPTM